jgi:hypothetical protein
MNGLLTVSPAVAGTLAKGRLRLAEMIVRQIAQGCCRLPGLAPHDQRPFSVVMETAVLHAQAFLWKNDVHSADRLIQNALECCVKRHEIGSFQHADWLFLARLAFLKDEADSAEMFLARAVATRKRHRSDQHASHATSATVVDSNHCTELLLEALLHLRQNRNTLAQDVLRGCELQHSVSDAPDLLRLVLLTHCCVELHNQNFQKAWRCFQAADILKLVGDSRYSVSRDTVVRSQRLWIRQLADLQHTAEDN